MELFAVPIAAVIHVPSPELNALPTFPPELFALLDAPSNALIIEFIDDFALFPIASSPSFTIDIELFMLDNDF